MFFLQTQTTTRTLKNNLYLRQNDYVHSKLSFLGLQVIIVNFLSKRVVICFIVDAIILCSVNDVGQVGDIIIITPLHV